MKKLITILTFFFALFCFSACQKSDTKTSEEKSEYITVHLGLSGDLQTKGTATNNLYGINVYYDPERDGNSNTHYAYGLFDNKEDMSITLLSGYTYKFECTLVKDGKTMLYCGQYGGNSFSGYVKPFQTNSSASTQLSNSFVYGTTYLSGITSGEATVKSISTGYVNQTMPSLQRYYGEIEGYTPVVGGTVVIPLKKTVFAARFIIDKVPEGQLTTECVIDSSSEILFSGLATNKLYDSGAILYSYPDVRACWLNEPTIPTTVNWEYTSSIFSQWNQSGVKDVTFKRNKLTTITISCVPDNASGGISLQEEAFGEDNNIYLYLNSDGVIVVGVDPNEDGGDD